MRKKIKIGKPYIVETSDSEIFGKAVKLCAKITMENPNTKNVETKECFFEFDQKYQKNICAERSDAFVIGLLSTAMENDMDIEFEMPLSERLYYQLTNYYIPMIAKYNSNYPLYNINLMGPFDDRIISNKKAVATGCSGGVDSFYTIAKHLSDEVHANHKLTHIVFSSNGITDANEERLKNNYKKNFSTMQKIADDCNIELIGCYNNLGYFYKYPYKSFVDFYTTTYCSVAFALQKLLSIYYASSGIPIEFFNLDISRGDFAGSAFDIFTLENLNTENLSFYSTGVEVNRNEKIKFISDFKPAQKNFVVCCAEISGGELMETMNCSNCKKCLRTMFSLYVINKLESFSDVFDIETFKKNINKKIGKILINDKDYTKISLHYAKENNVHISFMVYIYAYLVYAPLKIFRNIFKNSKIARKIYYKYDIDKKMNGYRAASYDYYMEKISKNDK